jgi:hypothetical protein
LHCCSWLLRRTSGSDHFWKAAVPVLVVVLRMCFTVKKNSCHFVENGVLSVYTIKLPVWP